MNGGLWRFSLAADYDPPLENHAWRLRHRGPHSRIHDLAGRTPMLAKVVIPRSPPRDNLRKYGLSQARREFFSSKRLARLGIATPAVLGWAVSISPLARYESILFMQELPPFESALTLIRTETSRQRRQDFLRRLAHDLGTLHGHGYIHKDCHFDNLCLLEDDSLVWIDNDIRKPRQLAARRRGLYKTLELLKNTARGTVHDSEWRFFQQQLGEALAHAPMGEELADEIR